MLQGVSHLFSGTAPCVIVCKGWCGWLYLLPAFGLQCLAVYSTHPDAVWIPTTLLDPPPLHHLTQWDFALMPVDCSLLLASGSAAWFHRLCPTGWLSHIQVLWSCTPADSTPCSLPNLPYRFSLVHHAHGGVLRGTFAFASSCPFASPPTPAPFSRGLHHIFSVAVQGVTPVVAPPAPLAITTNFIEWGDTLPALHPLVPVRGRSVFSPTKWGLRSLTSSELLAAFDIPQQEIHHARSHSDISALPYLSSTPLKLLHLALAHWDPTRCSLPKPILTHAPLAPLAKAYPKDIFPQLEASGAAAVAVKADDAHVPSELWDEQVWTGLEVLESNKVAFQIRYRRNPLDAIRKLALRAWRRYVRLSFMQYMRDSYGEKWAHCPAGKRDREVGRDCLWRVSFCDWWEWPRGSTPFFWRWPRSARMLARDGHPVWWIAAPPTSMTLQPPFVRPPSYRSYD
jgi:hypothetical protein